MQRAQWSKPVSSAEAWRRAGGRRRYNKERQREAHRRLEQVAQLLHDHDHDISTTEIAERLGVCRQTIWRDCTALRESIQLIMPDPNFDNGKVHVWARGQLPTDFDKIPTWG